MKHNAKISYVITMLVSALILTLAGASARAEPRLRVVASFSILGDLVREVAGPDVAVDVLVGPDGDVHVFQPAPADARRVAAARLVFMNGLGLEGWMPRLVKASGGKAAEVVLSRGVAPIRGEDDHQHHGGESHGEIDPHAWQSVANAKIYVANIRDALVTADPDGRAGYEKRAADYTAQLNELDAQVRSVIGAIPKQRRKIITTHDAFGYFSKAYGMDFIAPQGVSTEAEASSRDVARIIRQIREQKIPAVFLENISDGRLMNQIARETGAKLGGKVYSDSLSPPTGPAATYIDMIRHNIRAFSAALSG